MKPVQSRDGFARERDQLIIPGGVFGRGVGPVREEREVQLALGEAR